MNPLPTALRNNVVVKGTGERVMVFAHGFGCDQNMWRHVAPRFEDKFHTLVFDNPMAWSQTMAPQIMGNADHPELGDELTASFCRTDPTIAEEFARLTFTSDNRADLDRSTIRTLILHCSDDIIAPLAVGDFVHARIKNSELIVLAATGHCPNLSAPEEVVSAIRAFV